MVRSHIDNGHVATQRNHRNKANVWNLVYSRYLFLYFY
jgi:hypothetical protein